MLVYTGYIYIYNIYIYILYIYIYIYFLLQLLAYLQRVELLLAFHEFHYCSNMNFKVISR